MLDRERRTDLKLTEVGHMSPAAHVGIYTLDVNDPDGSSVVVRKTSASHLFMRTEKMWFVSSAQSKSEFGDRIILKYMYAPIHPHIFPL